MRLLIAEKFPEKFLADFRGLGLEVEYKPDVPAEDLAAAIVDANILVVRGKKVSAKAIGAAANLALIIRAGAGYDTIDVKAASERGIYVSNCPGRNSAAVAELAMGLIIALDRRIADGTADLRAGKWNKKEYGKADGLKGKMLGIVGMGQIGQAVARRAQAFDMSVMAWSRSLTPEKAEELGVDFCPSLEDLAWTSDIVSVHLAQAPETKGMFNAAFFEKMKKGAMFINTGRGGLHDQEAMKRAMKEKGLRVGLDVFANEPAEGTAAFSDELFSMPGFVGTHHIGASTEEAQNAIAAEAVRICKVFAETGTVPNVVNIEQHSPAKCQLIVRHYDKVGVLAAILGIIRQHGINVEEMGNTIFQGAKAAVATIRIGSAATPALLAEIAGLKDMVIHVEAK